MYDDDDEYPSIIMIKVLQRKISTTEPSLELRLQQLQVFNFLLDLADNSLDFLGHGFSQIEYTHQLTEMLFEQIDEPADHVDEVAIGAEVVLAVAQAEPEDVE